MEDETIDCRVLDCLRNRIAPSEQMLSALVDQATNARHITFIGTVAMSQREKSDFKREHPGAHMVIGDFEIKCLNPEKFGME